VITVFSDNIHSFIIVSKGVTNSALQIPFFSMNYRPIIVRLTFVLLSGRFSWHHRHLERTAADDNKLL